MGKPVMTTTYRDRHHRRRVVVCDKKTPLASPNEHHSNSVGVYPPAEASIAVHTSARMRKSRSILVLLVLLGFGVSLAVPEEDAPETPYDESETLPYESTPLFSIAHPQPSGQIAKGELNCGSPFRFDLAAKCRNRSHENYRESYCVPSSLTIISHSLRC